MSELPRYKLLVRVCHPFPEDLAEKHPNLAKSRINLTVHKPNISVDFSRVKEEKQRELVKQFLENPEHLNEDYFPIKEKYLSNVGVDVILWDRKKQETRKVFETEDSSILPKKLVDRKEKEELRPV